MDEDVGNQGQAPVFYKRDIVFSHIVVDQMTTGMYSDKQDYTIFYIGAKTGQIFKVSQWADQEGKQHSQLLDVFQATLEGEPIRAMEISRRLRMLYVSSDSMMKLRRPTLLNTGGSGDLGPQETQSVTHLVPSTAFSAQE